MLLVKIVVPVVCAHVTLCNFGSGPVALTSLVAMARACFSTVVWIRAYSADVSMGHAPALKRVLESRSAWKILAFVVVAILSLDMTLGRRLPTMPVISEHFPRISAAIASVERFLEPRCL